MAKSSWQVTLLLLLTLFWASFLPSLKFTYDIESFFSSDDPDAELYYRHRDAFGNENDFVLVGIKNREGIFQQDFLEKVDTLGKALARFERVKTVFSPANLYEAVKGPLGSIRIPVLHVSEPDKYDSDKSRIYSSDIYAGSFFSRDTQSVSLLIRKEGGLSRQVNDSLLAALNTLVSGIGFDEYHLAGRIRTQHYYVTRMQGQMALFSGLACVLFLVSLYVVFRNVRYVLVSLGAALMSLVWIFGIIGWLRVPIDLMLTLLPALILVISTSNSIHLLTRFRTEYQPGIAKPRAIRTAVRETGLPNFLNAFTTAVGFASLAMIPVAPIQRFGLFAATGILLSFFVGIMLIPAALQMLTLKPAGVAGPESRKPEAAIFRLVSGRPLLITGIFALFLIAGTSFSFRIEVNNHFLDDLNPASSLKRDLAFFEDNFSGIRPFEMDVRARDSGGILNYSALAEMDTVEKYLKTRYGAGFLFSPLTFIRIISKALNGGNRKYYRLPASQQELDEVLNLAEKQKVWQRLLPVLNDGHTVARIAGRTKDEGSRVFRQRNSELQEFLNERTRHLQYRVTGAAHLMDNANSYIARNLAKGILLAVAVTTLVIGLFTASPRLAMVSLIPNLLPLLLISGFMGVSGIPLKVSTALIFTIAYGIAVDDTIHFLNGYRLNRKIYGNSDEAIRQTILKMWRPMLHTSVVLFSGFMIFTLSEFAGISLLGLLVSASLIAALPADLLLLPVLLKYFR